MTCWVTRMRSVIHGNALRASPGPRGEQVGPAVIAARCAAASAPRHTGFNSHVCLPHPLWTHEPQRDGPMAGHGIRQRRTRRADGRRRSPRCPTTADRTKTRRGAVSMELCNGATAVALSGGQVALLASAGWTAVDVAALHLLAPACAVPWVRARRPAAHGPSRWTRDAAAAQAVRGTAGPWRCAQTHIATPATIIGTQSHWPMLMPSDRMPRKASGSRKYSAMKRNTP